MEHILVNLTTTIYKSVSSETTPFIALEHSALGSHGSSATGYVVILGTRVSTAKNVG